VKAVTDTLGVSRSHQYEKRSLRVKRYKRPDDEKYLPLIRKICDERPTYGYPAASQLSSTGFSGAEESLLSIINVSIAL